MLALLFITATQRVFAQDKKPKLSEDKQIAFDQHFINANKFIILKQPDEAIKELKLAMAINADNATVHFLLAQVYLGKSLLVDAEMHAQRSTQLDGMNTWYAKQLAEVYKQQKEYEKAGNVLAELYLANTDQMVTLFDATYMYVLSRKLDKALKLLETGEKNAGLDEDIIRQKQSIYLAQNKVDKAIKEGEKLIKAQPDNTKYIGMLADIYLSNGKEEKANELYRQILTMEPDNGYALLALADDYRNKLNNVEYINYMLKAIRSPKLDVKVKMKVVVEFISANTQTEEQKNKGFDLAIALTEANPEEAGTWMLLGDLYAQSEKYKDAHDNYEKAVLIDPSNYTVWRQMILCSNELRDQLQMIQDCERAIELFPEEALFYSYLTFATQQLKQYEKTIKVARKGIEVSIEQAQLKLQFYIMIGDAAHFLKEYPTSDSAYEMALTIDPNNAYALNNYSYFLSLRKQKLDRAAEMSKRSIELDSDNASYYDTFGWILFVQKKYTEAKVQIEKSLQMEPKNAEVVDHYGDVLFHLGEADKAVEQWKLAKSLNVENTTIDKKIKDRKWYEQ